ncbi:MAG TPA: phosphonate ABC transporter, permease protein PhnE [Candidatus Limnocylindria bacterium]|nr:phosphonate ABC transporter, permease protein PhnE [Candidatus Limnocylindria bacterium]
MAGRTGAALGGRTAAGWELRQPYDAKIVALVLLVVLGLGVSAQRVEGQRFLALSWEWAQSLVGLRESSQIGQGLARMGESLFPPQLGERTEVSRIESFDPGRLPWFSRIERQESREVRVNRETLRTETHVAVREFLVQPVGYLWRVAVKMVETLEIALWGTILAVVVSVPLAIGGARNYTPSPGVYAAARGLVSFLRAIPEMISALFLVLAYGFGPIAGILALGLHAAGFLGKFYAEDVENADRGPQEALQAIGAGKLKVLWFGVLPQVFPQYIAYTLYILDRNVRMAIVIGIVGAGGIGQELKGRYDMFNYGHVSTILLALFVTVFILDQVSARIRARLI